MRSGKLFSSKMQIRERIKNSRITQTAKNDTNKNQMMSGVEPQAQREVNWVFLKEQKNVTRLQNSKIFFTQKSVQDKSIWQMDNLQLPRSFGA